MYFCHHIPFREDVAYRGSFQHAVAFSFRSKRMDCLPDYCKIVGIERHYEIDNSYCFLI